MVKRRARSLAIQQVSRMVGAGEHAVAGGALLDKCKASVVDCARPANSTHGTDAILSSPEVTGRGGALSCSSVGASLGAGVGGAFNGLSNSPQVRVPASASGQGTVAVGSPNPRAIGSHMHSLRRAHAEVRRRRHPLPIRPSITTNQTRDFLT